MIQRARLFFFMALLIAGVIVVTNFPLGSLLHARTTVQTESAQLAALREANRTLSSEVRELRDPATVGQIAHEEYGLIEPGQRSVVVLPGKSPIRILGTRPAREQSGPAVRSPAE